MLLLIFLKEGVLEYAFKFIMFSFVKAVHIELPDKAINFTVSEESWQDYFFKFYNVFNGELGAVGRPINNFGVVIHLKLGSIYIKDLKCLRHKSSYLLISFRTDFR